MKTIAALALVIAATLPALAERPSANSTSYATISRHHVNTPKVQHVQVIRFGYEVAPVPVHVVAVHIGR